MLGRWFASCTFGVAAAAAGLPCACASAPSGEEDAGESSTETGDGGVVETAPQDACAGAAEVSTGTWHGSLRGYAGDLGGACGGGGPDAFLHLALTEPSDVIVWGRGVGFVPRIGVAAGECLPDAWLGCSEGLPLVLGNLPADGALSLVVGADPDDPVLDSPAPAEGESDAMAFEVDVLVRRILGAGEICRPESKGRCATGSACLEGDQGWRCTVLEGDTCATAQVVAIPAVTPVPIELEIDVLAPQTDAHHHGCTGLRMRERVIRLALSAELDPMAELEISTDDPTVGLAGRAPGCQAADEIACMAPGAGTGVTFTAAGVWAAAGVEPFVFVELPDLPGPPDPPPDGDPVDPIVIRLEVVDG